MSREKLWDAIAPRLFTSDGGTEGQIQVSDTIGFFVNQVVFLESSTSFPIPYEIKQIPSSTSIIVGNPQKDTNDRSDISHLLVSENATISLRTQPRVPIKQNIYLRAVYAEEPISALRSHLVDQYGDSYTVTNPVPVRLSDGSVNIGTVNAELEVQLSHIDNNPDVGDVADSVQVGDGVNTVRVNATDRSIDVNTFERFLTLVSNAKFMNLSNIDNIVPSVVGDITTMSYYEDGALLGTAAIRFVNKTDWDINFIAYINEDDGNLLLDDDDTSLLLE